MQCSFLLWLHLLTELQYKCIYTKIIVVNIMMNQLKNPERKINQDPDHITQE